MTWLTSEIEYSDFPLLLRKPDYSNIWEVKGEFTRLVNVEHFLERVMKNGLPENDYNQSLADFDHYMCTLLDKSDNGIIFLIETFGGKRNYYFYTLPHYDIVPSIKKAMANFKVQLKVTKKDDAEWGFLRKYPVQLFPT